MRARAAFTLLAAKDPATGYPRASELANLVTVVARDDSTVVLPLCDPSVWLCDQVHASRSPQEDHLGPAAT